MPEGPFQDYAETKEGCAKGAQRSRYPSREVVLKMLKLAGAHKTAIEYARKWICPVCAASQMPKAPLVTTPTKVVVRGEKDG